MIWQTTVTQRSRSSQCSTEGSYWTFSTTIGTSAEAIAGMKGLAERAIG